MVKGANNFWKFRGLIDGFNESRRQIDSGVEKTTDDSMSAIQFCTTHKGYLPQYSYILRNPEPLGTEKNNVVCSRLGTMLQIVIQKEGEDKKTSEFQKYIGGTTACMNRLSIATKGCGQLTSNYT